MKISSACTAVLAALALLMTGCSNASPEPSQTESPVIELLQTTPAMTGLEPAAESAWLGCMDGGNIIAVFDVGVDEVASVQTRDDYRPVATNDLSLRADESGFTIGATNKQTQICGVKVTVGESSKNADWVYLAPTDNFGSYTLPQGADKVLFVAVLANKGNINA